MISEQEVFPPFVVRCEKNRLFDFFCRNHEGTASDSAVVRRVMVRYRKKKRP